MGHRAPWPQGRGGLTGGAEIALFGGYESILNGALAVYLAFLINEILEEEYLPR